MNKRAALAHQWLRQMRHADERPAGHVHGGEEAVPRHVDDAALQRLLGREGDGVDDKIELAPVLGDTFEDRLHLAGRAHVERHHDRSFQLAGERLDVFLRLVVEIGHRQLRPERPERLGAAPRDRLVVGNADDEAPLAFEQLGLGGGNHGGTPLALGFGRPRLQVLVGDPLEVAKCLASVLGVIDVGDFPAVDFQMALAPGGDIYFKLVVSDGCDKLLNGGALPDGQSFLRFPVWMSRGHVPHPVARLSPEDADPR